MVRLEKDRTSIASASCLRHRDAGAAAIGNPRRHSGRVLTRRDPDRPDGNRQSVDRHRHGCRWPPDFHHPARELSSARRRGNARCYVHRDWRMVNSGSGRASFCPSGRGNVARISGRCTGPSSTVRHDLVTMRSSGSAASSIGAGVSTRCGSSSVWHGIGLRLGIGDGSGSRQHRRRVSVGHSGQNFLVKRRGVSFFFRRGGFDRPCTGAPHRTSCIASA